MTTDVRNCLELAHTAPGRIRLRWRGAGKPPASLIARLEDISSVERVDYRAVSHSLVLLHSNGLGVEDLRRIASADGVDVCETPEPGEPDWHVATVPAAAPAPNAADATEQAAPPRRPVVRPGESMGIRVVHASVPGRVRLQIDALRRKPRASARLQAFLEGTTGIDEADVNATGGVLVRYNPQRRTLRGILRLIADHLGAPASVRVAPEAGQPDAIREALTESEAEPDEGPASRALAPRDAYRQAASTPVADVLRQMGTPGANGLTAEEVARRMEQQAGNRLQVARQRSTGDILREQFISVPTGIMGAAMAVSLLTGGLIDAAVIGAVLVINGAIGYMTERYAEGAVEALRKLGFPKADVIRAGERMTVSAEALVPGDVIRLHSGSLVPADARIIEGSILVNEAMLTGESEPVAKNAEPTAAPQRIHEFRNVVFQGTGVVDGRARAVVLTTGRDTELGRIHDMVRETAAPRTRLQDELDVLGKTLGFGAAVVGAGLFGIGLLRGLPLAHTLETAVTLGVAAVPEALPAVATTALAIGMGRMLRRKVIIRKLPAVEALGSVTVLCVDKTGTLTRNRMTASRYVNEGRVFRYKNGDGKGRFLLDGRPVDPKAIPGLNAMLRVGVLCNEAKLWRGPDGLHVSGSSTEGALLLSGNAAGYWYRDLRAEYPTLHVYGRHEVRNRMATVHADPAGGLLVAVKGAPESVLELCAYRMDDHGTLIPLTDADRERYRANNRRMAEEGLRVLAFAQGHKDESMQDSERLQGLTWLGLVGLEDPIRPSVPEAMDRARQAGVRTVILTGDQRGTAMAVARSLGLTGDGRGVMEAHDLEKMPPADLAASVERVAAFARVSPQDKLRIVQALQAAGHVVAMTGDGINDGPALRAADIGIAMGEGSSDVAKELADVVLTRNDFGNIVAAVEQGRVIFTNIRRALVYITASNVSELMVAAATLVAGVGYPFNTVQILWMNLVSDVFPALALVAEPTDRDVMHQPPRAPDTPLIRVREWKGLLSDAAAMAAAALGAYGWAVSRYGFGALAGSIAFTAMTFGQALYTLACSGRSEQPGMGQHTAVVGTIAGTMALQVLVNHWAPLRTLLHTGGLGLLDYGVCAAAGLLPMLWSRGRSYAQGWLNERETGPAWKPNLHAIPAPV